MLLLLINAQLVKASLKRTQSAQGVPIGPTVVNRVELMSYDLETEKHPLY